MNGSLLLTPDNPNSDFDDIDGVKLALTEAQLIQAGESNSFLCGEKFSQLITFMGCSPHLVFEPPEDGGDKYCHVILHQHDTIQLLTGQQTAPPRCPSCRHRISDWKQYQQQWHEHTSSETWSCPACGSVSYPWQLDWRQSGGAGKIVIEIKNIFPGEAVPVDQLLAQLKNISKEKWRYFYIV